MNEIYTQKPVSTQAEENRKYEDSLHTIGGMEKFSLGYEADAMNMWLVNHWNFTALDIMETVTVKNKNPDTIASVIKKIVTPVVTKKVIENNGSEEVKKAIHDEETRVQKELIRMNYEVVIIVLYKQWGYANFLEAALNRVYDNMLPNDTDFYLVGVGRGDIWKTKLLLSKIQKLF